MAVLFDWIHIHVSLQSRKCARLITFLFSGLMLSCSSLQTPSFSGPGSFETQGPEEEHGELIWPVHRVNMSRGFFTSGRKPHLGLDLRGPRGTPILAAHSGTVVYAGASFRGYGRMILLEKSGDLATLYAHLDKIQVRQGQWIEQGQQIGTMGRTGRATGVHLHFEVILNKLPVDPLDHLTPPQIWVKNP